MPEPLPGPCGLCGAVVGARRSGALVCAACGWRYGDVPDHDLPMPRVEVVYYVRAGDMVKIGTSARPTQRLAALWFDELLAFEQGGRSIEQSRHAQFAALRGTGEWFAYRGQLPAHIAELRAAGPPWERYAQWISNAMRANT